MSSLTSSIHKNPPRTFQSKRDDSCSHALCQTISGNAYKFISNNNVACLGDNDNSYPVTIQTITDINDPNFLGVNKMKV